MILPEGLESHCGRCEGLTGLWCLSSQARSWRPDGIRSGKRTMLDKQPLLTTMTVSAHFPMESSVRYGSASPGTPT